MIEWVREAVAEWSQALLWRLNERKPKRSQVHLPAWAIFKKMLKWPSTQTVTLFFKMGHSLSLFLYFLSFLLYNWYIKFLWWLDLNRRALVAEVTVLPTEPQPLPKIYCYTALILPKYLDRLLFMITSSKWLLTFGDFESDFSETFGPYKSSFLNRYFATGLDGTEVSTSSGIWQKFVPPLRRWFALKIFGSEIWIVRK